LFDIHAHILPGIDDGPPTMEETIRMLRVAEKDGIKGIVATPHMVPGVHDNPKNKVLAALGDLKQVLGPDFPVKVYAGSEVSLCAESLIGIREGRYLTINSGRYILLELPSHFINKNVFDFIFSLTSAGMIPVIAHPERNAKVQRDVKTLYELANLGALMQATAASFSGFFGSGVRKFALGLVEKRLVHVVASDAHDPERRCPALSPSLKELKKLLNEEECQALLHGNPEKIINNEYVEVEPPRKPKTFFFMSEMPFFDY